MFEADGRVISFELASSNGKCLSSVWKWHYPLYLISVCENEKPDDLFILVLTDKVNSLIIVYLLCLLNITSLFNN